MTIKLKLLAMISVPILALLAVSVLGLSSFKNIESSIQHVNSLHMDRATMIDADRDAYQAQMALVHAESARDAKTLDEARRSSDENLAQTWERISGPAGNFTPDMANDFADFEASFNKWKAGNVGALEITKKTLDINAKRNAAESKALSQYGAMREVIDQLGELAEKELARSIEEGKASTKRQATLARALSGILNADRDSYQAYTALLDMKRADTRDALTALAASYEENATQTRDRVSLGADLIGDKAAALKEAFLGLFESWNGNGREYVRLTTEGFQDNRKRAALLEESEAAFAAMRDRIDKLGEAEANRVRANIDDMNRTIKTTMLSYLIIAAIFIIAAVALALFMSARIAGAIKDSARAAHQITEGDFDINLSATGRDETAQLQSALNDMASTLSRNIGEIHAKTTEAEEKAEQARQATARAEQAMHDAEIATRQGILQAAESLEGIVQRVASASEELSQQSDVLSRGSALQSERIQETATAMEEMNTTVLEIARNASEAATSGQEAISLASEGAEVVRKSMAAMSDSVEEVHSLRGNMDKLDEQAKGIGAIIGVINDIADQTNLLALNAAIEAARAGEAGRGFAVVADEVRKLAEKTMDATKEVNDSITAIQKVATENLSAMENVFKSISNANANAVKSGEVLQTIVASSEENASQVDSIATAAEEQSATSEEINQSIDDINQVTMENSRGISESSTALTELAHQLAELKAIIERLKKEGNDTREAAPAPENDAEEEEIPEPAGDVLDELVLEPEDTGQAEII